MTQQETAVGGGEPVIAAEPTLEDRFAALSGEIQEEEPAEGEAPQGDDPPAEDEPELEAEDLEDEDTPPIPPPGSWPDEDKAAFAELPRQLQDIVSKREEERERFVQAKSREATQARQQAETAAQTRIRQMQDTQIQQLVALLPELPQEPSAHLLVQDPAAYASEMDYFRQMRAYRASIEDHIHGIAQAQQQAEQQHQAASIQASVELLKDEFPEFLDGTKTADLQKQLRSTGLALGYSEDQLKQVDGQDILAMRKAGEWKAKADRFDALMAKQMERVREGKKLPRISRPGSAGAKGLVANQRYQADREAMRNGDRDAAVRVFKNFL